MKALARNHLLPFVILVAVASLILAGCSRSVPGEPQKMPPAAAGETKAVPTVVVLDASESMQTADAPGPRIEAARSAVTALADSLPEGTDFGVVAFGSTKPVSVGPEQACTDVTTAVPLGPLNKAQLRTTLDGLAPQGFTPIGSALQAAADQLPESGAGSIVLVSDGASTCAPDPCETAARIHQDRPDITISAVGFRTDDSGLECIADEGGGLFVTADNAAQLTARLAAAQNAQVAALRLSPTSRHGIEIGQSLAEIRRSHPDFPASGRTDGKRVIYVYVDCTYVFEDDALVEIGPGDPPGSAGTTIDGVTKGTPGTRAVELYGQPVQDSDGVAIFTADQAAGTAYRIGYTGGDSIDTATVTTVVLCRCLPGTGGSTSGGPEANRVVAVDKSGNPINGFTRGKVNPIPYEAEYCRPGVGAITKGVYFCGAGASAVPNCWPAGGKKMLCAVSPTQKELIEITLTGTLPDDGPKDDPMPWTLTLADGTECLQKFAGAWDMPPPGFSDAYSCKATNSGDYKFVYLRTNSAELFDKSGDAWKVWFGNNKSAPQQVAVAEVTYSAAE